MNNTSAATPHLSTKYILLEPQVTWYWSARVVISILTILGNGLILFLIATKKRLQVTNNWFVLSLAASDFCVGLFVTPTGLVCCYWLHCDLRLQLVCYNFLLFASTLNLWTMTFDRYVAIVHSLKYVTLMKASRVRKLVAFSWGVSLFASAVRLFWLYDSNLRMAVDKYYTAVIDFCFGVLSCVLLLAAYFVVLFIVRKHTSLVASQKAQISYNHRHCATRRKERDRLSARVLGAVVGLFVACYFLSICVSFCRNFKLCSFHRNVGILSVLLVHVNCSVNFIAYALLKKDFRDELKSLCGFFKHSSLTGLHTTETATHAHAIERTASAVELHAKTSKH